MSAPHITATVEPKGSKFFYRVYEDGREVATRTSARRYTVIHVQRWLPVGATDPGTPNPVDGWQKYAAPEAWAPRYSTKPKPVGSKIEYGFCAANVEIQEVGA